MATIAYKLSRKQQADGKRQVIVWLRFTRTFQPQLPTGVYVAPEHFEVAGNQGGNEVGNIVIPKRGKLNFVAVKEATQASIQLTEYTNRLVKVCEVTPAKELTKEYVKNAIEAVKDVPVEDITHKLVADALNEQNEAKIRKTFFGYSEQYKRERGASASEDRHFNGLMRCMHRWQMYRTTVEGEFAINIDTLTADDLQDLKEYMMNEHSLQNEYADLYAKMLEEYPAEQTPKHKGTIRQKGANTVHKLFRWLKTYWRWLVQKEYTSNDPFRKFELKDAVYGTPYYLTIEERNKIADYNLTSAPALAIQRDIFVFQCLIGCRVSDLYSFSQSNIVDGFITYIPHKTKDHTQQRTARVPLNERARALAEKYKGADSKGRLFPFIAQQNYNEAIKKVLKKCGIDRTVPVRNSLTGENEMKPLYEVASSHMARRTFVGNAYAKVKDPNLIGKMSGHVEGSKAFARYRNIEDEALKEVINLIE